MRRPEMLPLSLAAVLAGTGAWLLWTVPASPEVEPHPPLAVAEEALDTALPDEVLALRAAQAEVDVLRDQIETTGKALDKARRELARVHAGRADLKEEVGRLGADAERMGLALAEATVARDELLDALVGAEERVAAVDAARAAWAEVAAGWRDHAVNVGFDGFVADAKVALCARGSARRLERCHAVVDDLLRRPRVQRAYAACVSEGQAMPVLARVPSHGEVPDHAMVLPSERPLASDGWYVAWCDPTLPEALDLDAPG